MVGTVVYITGENRVMFNFNELETDNSDLLCLKISSADQQAAWQESQNQSNAIARYNAYLNRLCLKTLLKWFSDWLADTSLPQPSVLFSTDTLFSLWEVVNGIIIEVGKTKLVLIPSDNSDLEELSVPQEWVDIPDWIADYYLAVQVNLDGEEDESWIQVCGFTTHRQLRNHGRYNESDRTYSLPRETLMEDLSAIELTMALHLQTEVAPLPSLSATQITKLLQILGDSSLYSPRLKVEIPFAEWAALIVNESYRKQLYKQRINQLLQNKVAAALSSVEDVLTSKKPFDLKQWLQNKIAAGKSSVEDIWQSFEMLFAQPEAVRSRGDSHTNEPEAIAPVIRLLQPNQHIQIRRQAAGVLGEIGVGNPDAIKALIELFHDSTDEETRWQASLSLGKVDPENPLAGLRKARIIDLGMQLAGHKVGLIVAIMPKAEGRIGISLQVQPLDNSTRLPPDLKLSVLSESGETIPGLETKARSDDEGKGKDRILELRFSPPPGTTFQVRVSCGDLNIIEHFTA